MMLRLRFGEPAPSPLILARGDLRFAGIVQLKYTRRDDELHQALNCRIEVQDPVRSNLGVRLTSRQHGACGAVTLIVCKRTACKVTVMAHRSALGGQPGSGPAAALLRLWSKSPLGERRQR